MQGMKTSEQNNTLEITIIKGKERKGKQVHMYQQLNTIQLTIYKTVSFHPYVVKIMYRDGAF